MTLNQNLVIKKLELMNQYQEQLDQFLKFSDNDILLSSEKYLSIERVFQLLVDSMIDINQHLIRELKLGVPDDLQSTFYPLSKAGILPHDFTQKIAPIVGVRNRLVHQYEELDKDLFLKNLRKNFSDFEVYQKHIKDYLSRIPSSRC